MEMIEMVTTWSGEREQRMDGKNIESQVMEERWKKRGGGGMRGSDS